MATIKHRSPVVVRHPITEQFVSYKRGDEVADSDPIVKSAPWLFEDDESGDGARVTSVSIPEVEQATAGPGEQRTTRRRRR